MTKSTRKHNEYIDAIMGKDRCPDCHHHWWQHSRQANGAYACRYWGCGCKDVTNNSSTTGGKNDPH